MWGEGGGEIRSAEGERSQASVIHVQNSMQDCIWQWRKRLLTYVAVSRKKKKFNYVTNKGEKLIDCLSKMLGQYFFYLSSHSVNSESPLMGPSSCWKSFFIG